MLVPAMIAPARQVEITCTGPKVCSMRASRRARGGRQAGARRFGLIAQGRRGAGSVRADSAAATTSGARKALLTQPAVPSMPDRAPLRLAGAGERCRGCRAQIMPTMSWSAEGPLRTLSTSSWRTLATLNSGCCGCALGSACLRGRRRGRRWRAAARRRQRAGETSPGCCGRRASAAGERGRRLRTAAPPAGPRRSDADGCAIAAEAGGAGSAVAAATGADLAAVSKAAGAVSAAGLHHPHRAGAAGRDGAEAASRQQRAVRRRAS